MEKDYVDQYVQLGLNIGYYRRLKRMSQLLLAEKVKISRTHMSRIENCDCLPSLDVVFRIAEALDIEVWQLFKFK